jgi:hypothetical protein
MKPQVMTAPQFFLELCSALGLDPTVSDEDSVIRAIVDVKQELKFTEMALEINQAQLVSLETQLDKMDEDRNLFR